MPEPAAVPLKAELSQPEKKSPPGTEPVKNRRLKSLDVPATRRFAPFLEGTACVTSLTPGSQNLSGAGGPSSFNVTAPGGCNWTAVSNDSFVTITSGANGSGNGTVNFSVAGNIGPQRSATIVVGGQVFNITQDPGGSCAPTPISIGQTVNGNLTTSACPLGDGTFYDPYSFSGTAGQRVAVSMTSSQFDTFLFLNRPDGSTFTIDDDGAGGTNSHTR